MTAERHCLTPEHHNNPFEGDETECAAAIEQRDGLSCVPAVLVPVTQRQAEQATILRALEHLDRWADDGTQLPPDVEAAANELIALLPMATLEELRAMWGIPVDTEAGNG